MVNTRARSPWLALRPKEGSQATHPRIACLRRQAGVGRDAGRARSLRRCGHIPTARQRRSQGPACDQPVSSRCAAVYLAAAAASAGRVVGGPPPGVPPPFAPLAMQSSTASGVSGIHRANLAGTANLCTP
jgi:hypothetical protein